MVVKPLWCIVIWPVPAIDLPELRPPRGLTIPRGRGAQRAAGLAFLIGVMQDKNVGIAFLVLAGRIFRGHPRPIAFGVKRRHVDLGLALHHQLRQVIASAARRRDPERKPLGQPHVTQAGRRADQRIAVRGITDRAVEIVFQTNGFRRRYTVDEGHVFPLDPVQIEREQIGAERVRHAIFEPGRGVFLIRPQNPAPPFLAHIPFRIGITQHRMLRVILAIFDQHRVGLGHDELMFHRNGGAFDTQQPRRALGMVAGGRDDMFRMNNNGFVGRHKVSTLLDHLGAGHFPMIARPFIAICLPAPLDHGPMLPRAFGHRHGHVGGVDIAIGRVKNRALKILGAHQRPTVLDLPGRHPFKRHIAGFRRGRIDHVFVHPRLGLGHAQIADHGKTGVQPGLGLERFIEIDRIFVDMRGRKGHVEQRQQASGMPG